MIELEKIKALVSEEIEGTNLFLVDIKIDAMNNISVYVDSPMGVEVTECVSISKYIEEALDRDVADFSLEVSSPGIGYPFLVQQQFDKAIDKTIEVLLSSGIKKEGILKKADKNQVVIEYSVKEKVQGAKRPKEVIKKEVIDKDLIKSVKEIIIFR